MVTFKLSTLSHLITKYLVWVQTFSKMKPRTTLSSHFAHMTNTSATGEFVILKIKTRCTICWTVTRANFKWLSYSCIAMVFLSHQVLDPFRIYVPVLSSYRALVSMPLGSLPWLGSVKPKQPINSPLPVKLENGRLKRQCNLFEQ